jgi:hypothetical protein
MLRALSLKIIPELDIQLQSQDDAVKLLQYISAFRLYKSVTISSQIRLFK